MGMDWDSAIVDEGRNLKGPSEDYARWTRPLQIAIFRTNGSHFRPGQRARFRVALINEGALPAGEYQLEYRVTDGRGNTSRAPGGHRVDVRGGDRFSQTLPNLELLLSGHWHGGHVTIEGRLLDPAGDLAARGQEQVLLDNPASFGERLRRVKGAVRRWPEAKAALVRARAKVPRYSESDSYDVIAAGEAPRGPELTRLLDQVRGGARLLIPFSPAWADSLYDQGVLAERVTDWGCQQEGFWYGNGWGYLSEYVGSQAILSDQVVGTNGWEPLRDPQGFYPLRSPYPIHVHGLWLARHDVLRVLLATVTVGRGQLVLSPAYPPARGDVLADLIFFEQFSRVPDSSTGGR